MEKEKVIAVLKSQPAWQPLVRTIVLGVAGFLILLAIFTAIFTEEISYVRSFLISFEIIFLVSIVGLALLIRKKTFLDLKNNRFKNEFSLGWIKRGEWKNLPRLDYVAVFSNEAEHFDVNVWYNRNKHNTLFTFKDEHSAFDIACRIALEQDVKLLDATVRTKKHFVDVSELSQKYGYEPSLQTS